MDKKGEKDELEGLRADDGSQPVTKGVKIVEYNRIDPDRPVRAKKAPRFRIFMERRETYPKQGHMIWDKKSEEVTAREKTKKGTAASTKERKKGGRK